MSVSIESVTGCAQMRYAIGHIKTLPGAQLRSASSLFTDWHTCCSNATHTHTCSHAGNAKYVQDRVISFRADDS